MTSTGSIADTEHPQRTILVVDDDPNTLEMHARIVQSHSPANRVLKARNGLEALAILGREPVDLVLLDLMMPEMDGFAVLEAMRDRDASPRHPCDRGNRPDADRGGDGTAEPGRDKGARAKALFGLEETLVHLDAALMRKRGLSGEAQRLVRQAMAYLHEHYAEPISRQDLARHVGLSDDYLTSCFHKELGLTPVAYLNRYRVQQARQLLKNTHKSITEIALEVGFSGSSYFSRIFRRETGMSPEGYRAPRHLRVWSHLLNSIPSPPPKAEPPGAWPFPKCLGKLRVLCAFRQAFSRQNLYNLVSCGIEPDTPRRG